MIDRYFYLFVQHRLNKKIKILIFKVSQYKKMFFTRSFITCDDQLFLKFHMRWILNDQHGQDV